MNFEGAEEASTEAGQGQNQAGGTAGQPARHGPPAQPQDPHHLAIRSTCPALTSGPSTSSYSVNLPNLNLRTLII